MRTEKEIRRALEVVQRTIVDSGLNKERKITKELLLWVLDEQPVPEVKA